MLALVKFLDFGHGEPGRQGKVGHPLDVRLKVMQRTRDGRLFPLVQFGKLRALALKVGDPIDLAHFRGEELDEVGLVLVNDFYFALDFLSVVLETVSSLNLMFSHMRHRLSLMRAHCLLESRELVEVELLVLTHKLSVLGHLPSQLAESLLHDQSLLPFHPLDFQDLHLVDSLRELVLEYFHGFLSLNPFLLQTLFFLCVYPAFDQLLLGLLEEAWQVVSLQLHKLDSLHYLVPLLIVFLVDHRRPVLGAVVLLGDPCPVLLDLPLFDL